MSRNLHPPTLPPQPRKSFPVFLDFMIHSTKIIKTMGIIKHGTWARANTNPRHPAEKRNISLVIKVGCTNFELTNGILDTRLRFVTVLHVVEVVFFTQNMLGLERFFIYFQFIFLHRPLKCPSRSVKTDYPILYYPSIDSEEKKVIGTMTFSGVS
ncbi:hypothetical protein BCR42DRAFT_396159 [Absidia repens]|uniref:Uncharacterized protein n=1 Tax=Absidia repens TaxID=90262 RepID=A0A1X2I4V6_9FUNG|nr:hypothetical protein BCR42DRAFT_396159 [Absidia repens]